MTETLTWKPIETAPKNEWIFVGKYAPEGDWVCVESCHFLEVGNAMEGETWSGWVWACDHDNHGITEDPHELTHWAEKPKGPKRGGGSTQRKGEGEA